MLGSLCDVKREIARRVLDTSGGVAIVSNENQRSFRLLTTDISQLHGILSDEIDTSSRQSINQKIAWHIHQLLSHGKCLSGVDAELSDILKRYGVITFKGMDEAIAYIEGDSKRRELRGALDALELKPDSVVALGSFTLEHTYTPLNSVLLQSGQPIDPTFSHLYVQNWFDKFREEQTWYSGQGAMIPLLEYICDQVGVRRDARRQLKRSAASALGYSQPTASGGAFSDGKTYIDVSGHAQLMVLGAWLGVIDLISFLARVGRNIALFTRRRRRGIQFNVLPAEPHYNRLWHTHDEWLAGFNSGYLLIHEFIREGKFELYPEVGETRMAKVKYLIEEALNAMVRKYPRFKSITRSVEELDPAPTSLPLFRK
jgi:hypothetical protein